MRNWRDIAFWSLVDGLVALVVTVIVLRLAFSPELFAQTIGTAVLLSFGLGVAMGVYGNWQIMLAQERHVSLRQISDYDALTGLLSRARFMELAERRVDANTVIAMLDIDHFKSVNDLHGHLVGDAVIRSLAQCLPTFCEGEDLVARYGGEEFVLCLLGVGVEAASARLEELRQSVEETEFTVDSVPHRMTVSIGLAEARGRSLLDAMAAADFALLTAKRRGRNRVVTSGPRSVDPPDLLTPQRA